MAGTRQVGRGTLGALLGLAWVGILAVYMILSQSPRHVPPPRMLEGPSDLDDASTSQQLAASLAALDTFAPLRPNVLPLYNITVRMCYPVLGCSIRKATDEHAGPWVRVERPLSSIAAQWRGTMSLKAHEKLLKKLGVPFLFYRRALARDGEQVADVRLVPASQPLPPEDHWHRMPIPSGVLPRNEPEYALHVRMGQNATEGVTELDVLYGPNPPPPGFEVVGHIRSKTQKLNRNPEAKLLVRRTPPQAQHAPVLRFRDTGTFTILQLADLHFSVEELPCRDVERVETCASQNDTLALLERWLDEEKPDLVVFTGDQLNGQDTSWDEHSVMPGWLDPIVRRGIPWMPLFGNHDSETGILTRREQMELLALYPYSLAQVGPSTLHGAGNYDVAVRAPAPDQQELLTLWSLDSGAHPPFSLLRPWQKYLYDWVHPDQVQWLVGRLRQRMPRTWPYQPRLRPQKASRRSVRPGSRYAQRMRRPPGIVFVHIPIQEAFDAVDRDAQGNELRFGVREERYARLGGQGRRGLFDALEKERNGVTPGVRLYVHGHMHNNEDCRRVRGVWICFGGGASYAAYGKLGFARRARVYQAQGFGQTLVTWHRRDDRAGRIEERVLV